MLVAAFFFEFFIVASTLEQMLTITLDESDCFAAWVSAKDAGFSSTDGSDPKRKIAENDLIFTAGLWCIAAAGADVISPLRLLQ